MQAKSLNTNGHQNRQVATDLNPADFPLGSLQSRAIARRLSAQLNSLPPADEDAFILFGGAVYLNARMSPGYKELEGTEVYKRGEELSLQRYGAMLPASADPRSGRATAASLEFERVFGREPEPGDVLTRAQVYKSHGPEEIAEGYGAFIEAWSRQLPELPCPLRLESGRLFRRLAAKSEDGSEWEEAVDEYGAARWRSVEFDAFGELMSSRGVNQREQYPQASSVVFAGIVDGQYRCQPVK